MDIQKDRIQRYDFSEVAGGYDRDEVNDHLRYVLQVVDRLGRQAREPQSPAAATASQVEIVLQAADGEARARKQEATQAATDLQQSARRKAEMTLRTAAAGAQEKQRMLEASVADHVRRNHSAAAKVSQRGASSERRITQLADRLPRTDEVVNELTSRASSLRSALDETQRTIESLRQELLTTIDAPKSA